VNVLSTADISGTGTGGALTCAGGVNISKTLFVEDGIRLGTMSSVIQATSNTTAVTINARFGTIQTFGSNIAAHDNVEFVVNNSFYGAGRQVLTTVQSYTGNGAPIVSLRSGSSGQFTIRISNAINDAINDSIQFFFMVL